MLSWFVLAAACTPETLDPVPAAAPLIHGTDDRVEVADTVDGARAIQATAALMLTSSIDADGTLAQPDGSVITLGSGSPLSDVWELCPGERFADQPTYAFCSATMIAEDLLLTADHCVPDNDACETTRVVFDYAYKTDGVLGPIDANDVYDCARIVSRDGAADYAIIQVDRPIEARTPVDIRLTDPRTCFGVDVGDQLTAYGFPSGIPMKIDSGGVVTQRAVTSGRFFQATFDSFAVQNGGGVFNANDELVGIIQSGQPDYVLTGNDCYEVNVLDDTSSEQTALHITQAIWRHCAADARLLDSGVSTSVTLCPGFVQANCDEPGDGGVAVFPPSSGCGCRVGRASPPAPITGLLTLLALVCVARTRRRRHTRGR